MALENPGLTEEQDAFDEILPEEKFISIISDREIISACVTIVGFTFASLGFLSQDRSLTENNILPVIRSLLIILIVFTVPIALYLLVEFFQRFVPETIRKKRVNQICSAIKIYFLISLATIPFAFYEIARALKIDIWDGEESLWLVLAIFVIIMFCIFIMLALLWEKAEGIIQSVSKADPLRIRFIFFCLILFFGFGGNLIIEILRTEIDFLEDENVTNIISAILLAFITMSGFLSLDMLISRRTNDELIHPFKEEGKTIEEIAEDKERSPHEIFAQLARSLGVIAQTKKRVLWKSDDFNLTQDAAIWHIDIIKRQLDGERFSIQDELQQAFLFKKNPPLSIDKTQIRSLLHGKAGPLAQNGFDPKITTWKNIAKKEAFQRLEEIGNQVPTWTPSKTKHPNK